ncbi:MAG: ATPase [Muribaculaceae bacterium]|nr:ATPase [Muribaculaceae bacterium]
MKIIADAGGTKTDWLITDYVDGEREFFTGGGINPSVMTEDEIAASLLELKAKLDSLPAAGPTELYFYGAGCNSQEMAERLKKIFEKTVGRKFEKAEFNSDILGAARALFGRRSGVVCILGTGSASALYDGKSLVDSIPSLGYVLGDEGSGAFMGKMLLNRYFKRELSAEINAKLEAGHRVGVTEVIRNVYRSPAPNRYLASFVPFLKENQNNEEIESIISDSQKLFFQKNVLKYKGVEDLAIGFIGGVADAFSERLSSLAYSYGFREIKFIKTPIKALGEYHRSQQPQGNSNIF